MSLAPPIKQRVLLSSGNLAAFRKQIQHDCQAKYGASGLALRTNTNQIIPTLPSQTALQADGTFLYEHDNDSLRLSDRGYAEFKADVARFRLRDDLRIADDTNLYRHILDNMSPNSVLETESNSAFPMFLLQPLGDQAVPFMNLTIQSHSSGDALTTFSRAQLWLSLKHEPLSDTLLETFDKINAGGDQFAADFGSEQYPNHVSIDKLKALITMSCLPGNYAPFQSAVFFRQAPQTFDYPSVLQAEINNWSSAHSANFTTDSVSEQGQSSAFLSTNQRNLNNWTSAHNARYATNVEQDQSSAFLSATQRPHPLPHSNPTTPRPHCPNCYLRTGNKYHNHGVPNTPPCYHVPRLSTAPPIQPPPQSYMSLPYDPQHFSPPPTYAPQYPISPHVHFADTPPATLPSPDNPIIAAAHAYIANIISNPTDHDSDSSHATLQNLYEACSDPSNRP